MHADFFKVCCKYTKHLVSLLVHLPQTVLQSEVYLIFSGRYVEWCVAILSSCVWWCTLVQKQQCNILVIIVTCNMQRCHSILKQFWVNTTCSRQYLIPEWISWNFIMAMNWNFQNIEQNLTRYNHCSACVFFNDHMKTKHKIYLKTKYFEKCKKTSSRIYNV